MARDSWYRLDNVGRFYSAQAGHTAQTVFRIAADMADEVDPDALQRALEQALEVFPGFNVTLRAGFFWHYLQQAEGTPRVQPENLPPCSPMHADPRSVLIRVSYHAHRINVEVSHMVSDGRGTMELFKTLVGLYVRERYGACVELAPYAREEAHKTEDSFSENYERRASASTPKPKAYRIRGWREKAAPEYMEVHLSSSAVYAAAKGMGVGVTALLIAAIMCAVRDGMPAVAADVSRQLGAVTEPAALKKRMNRMVKLQRNAALRVAPVFLKDAVLGLAAAIAEREVTTTASNLGRVEMPRGTEPFVRSVVVLTSTTGIDFVMSTYGDDLSVGVSSVLVSNDIQRRFVRTFSALGADVAIDVNRSGEEVDAALRQEHMERVFLHHEDERGVGAGERFSSGGDAR